MSSSWVCANTLAAYVLFLFHVRMRGVPGECPELLWETCKCVSGSSVEETEAGISRVWARSKRSKNEGLVPWGRKQWEAETEGARSTSDKDNGILTVWRGVDSCVCLSAATWESCTQGTSVSFCSWLDLVCLKDASWWDRGVLAQEGVICQHSQNSFLPQRDLAPLA